ncbi:uncharacterized protein PRCAT00004384001 [Priceomyces carsonii]|uniref:uncharacterized protein n=1 Tax=Priceomyces carsonii TaxID=28549 RepID=UPI002EDB8F4C|nr:unnamed protein product [Priceomyces carsonii]
MQKTKEELRKLIDSYKDSLEFWKKSLYSEGEDTVVKAAEVAEPLQEMSKLAALIKAHTTKVGIIFKPESLKSLTNAAFDVLKSLSDTEYLIISVLAQLKPVILSQIFYDEICDTNKLILQSSYSFAIELLDIFDGLNDNNESDEENKNGIDKRLVSVGQIWGHCDELVKLLKGGNLGLLSSKIKQSILLIEDGFDEFEEWANDPQDIDDGDPFGFSDDESLEEDQGSSLSLDSPGDSSESKKELIEFSKKWVQKIKLVKLLLSSLVKSLPSVPKGEVVDKIYLDQKKLVSYIDKLIVDLMLNQTVDVEARDIERNINRICTKLLKSIKEINKSNETKIRWCSAWESKFNEQ